MRQLCFGRAVRIRLAVEHLAIQAAQFEVCAVKHPTLSETDYLRYGITIIKDQLVLD